MSSDGVNTSFETTRWITLQQLLSLVPLSANIVKGTQWAGYKYYGFRLECFLSGCSPIGYAWITWYVCSLFAPVWLYWAFVEVRLAWHILYLQIPRIDRAIRGYGGTKNWQYCNWIFWLIWTVWLHYNYTIEWRLTAHHAFMPQLLGLLASSLTYLLSDGPLEVEKVSMVASWDTAMGYFLTLWLVADRERILWWSRLLVFRFFDSILYEALYRADLYSGTGVLGIVLWLWDSAVRHYRNAIELILLCGWTLLPMLIFFIGWMQSTQPSRYANSRILIIYNIVMSTFSKLSALYDLVEAWLVYDVLKEHQYKCCLEVQSLMQSDGSGLYNYQPLETGHIRLLKLHKATISGGITAELIHCPVSDDVPYEALSYNTLDQDFTREVIVEGDRLAITKSAFELLLAHRSFFYERLVWLEGVCVDKQNPSEKNSQTALKSTIFRNAYRTILFPGGSSNYRIAAFLLYELGAHYSPTGRPTNVLVSPVKPDLSLDTWASLITLFLEQYFVRVWTVAEVVAGNDVQLLLGGIYVPWQVLFGATQALNTPTFTAALAALANSSRAYDTRCGATPALIGMMTALREHSSEDDGTYLPYLELRKPAPLLVIMSQFKASDLRDSLFACAGLTTMAIDIDYSKDIEELYIETAKTLLLGPEPCEDMLSLAGFGSRKAFTATRTWIPILNAPFPWHSFSDLTLNRPRFNAGGSRHNLLITDTRYLLIEGVMVDSILEMDIPMQLNLSQILSESEKLARAFNDRFTAMLEMCEKHAALLSPASNLDLAMVADGFEELVYPENPIKTLHALLKTLVEANQGNPIDMAQFMMRLAELSAYLTAMVVVWAGRRFAITKEGRYALVPPYSQVGDEICVFMGARAPYVLARRKDLENMHQLQGECYLQGMMNGEALDRDTQQINIV